MYTLHLASSKRSTKTTLKRLLKLINPEEQGKQKKTKETNFGSSIENGQVVLT